jgi:hypothetical protein
LTSPAFNPGKARTFPACQRTPLSHARFLGNDGNCLVVFFCAKKTIYRMTGGSRMDIAAADELIRQLRAIEDLRPSTPTAHEGRQLTTAFLKVESQIARRVIIELVEKLAARPRLQG